jgi:hypothetical protein
MKAYQLMGVVMSVVRTEKRERSVAGKLIKWAFIAFNVLMAVWIVGGLHSVSKIQAHSAAEQIGTGIGATIGITVILVLWALGDLILGILVLVSRGDKVVIEESISTFANSSSTSSASSFDMSRVDERIAQLKAEASSPRTTVTASAPSSPSFGRRRV